LLIYLARLFCLSSGKRRLATDLNALDGYRDFIAPQYYDQGGGDGMWVEGIRYLTQNDGARKEEFLYLTERIVSDTLRAQLPAGTDIRRTAAPRHATQMRSRPAHAAEIEMLAYRFSYISSHSVDQ